MDTNINCLTNEDCLKLLNPLLVDVKRDRLFFCMMLYSGEKALKVRHTKWVDVFDFEISKAKSVFKLSNGHNIEVCEDLQEAIEAYYNEINDYFIAKGISPIVGEDYILNGYMKYRKRDTPLTHQSLSSRIIKKWYNLLGIKAQLKTSLLRKMHVKLFQEAYGINATIALFGKSHIVDMLRKESAIENAYW